MRLVLWVFLLSAVITATANDEDLVEVEIDAKGATTRQSKSAEKSDWAKVCLLFDIGHNNVSAGCQSV